MARTTSTYNLQHLSRRTFCQGAAVMGASLGLLGLAGCAPHTATDEVVQAWIPGTYTAEVNGHNAPYTMTVTFSDNAITAIDTASNQESFGVGYDALQTLTDQAMEYQTLNVDAVTGATLSSMSFTEGLQNCADQAGALEALQAADAPAPADIKDTYDTDVCVVGGGGAGLASAIAAVQAGASVIVM